MITSWTGNREQPAPTITPPDRVDLQKPAMAACPQAQVPGSVGVIAFGKAPAEAPSIRLSAERDSGWCFYVPQGRDARACDDSGDLQALQELPRNPEETAAVEIHRVSPLLNQWGAGGEGPVWRRNTYQEAEQTMQPSSSKHRKERTNGLNRILLLIEGYAEGQREQGSRATNQPGTARSSVAGPTQMAEASSKNGSPENAVRASL